MTFTSMCSGVNCCALSMLLFLLYLSTETVNCYPTYKFAIPNGNKVPNPCDPSSFWEAVGHKNPFVTAPHNPFGKDFLRNGLTWTRQLCKADSDGDGRTNGEELGDPLCEWSRENPISLLSVKGHPGICEPIDSTFCQSKPNQYACPGLPDKSCPAYIRNDTQQLALNMTRTHVPIKESSYVCLEVRLPSDSDYHLLAAKPVVENDMVVDQIQIFACDSGLHSRVYNHPFECGEKPRGDCQSLIGGFSSHERGICFPPNSGYKIGQSGCRQLIFQIRYKNPYLNPALYDSSGVILYYTNNLQSFDLGTKLVSVTHFTLPKSNGKESVSTEYPEDCSAIQIKEPIFITSAFVHMHKYGRQQRVTLMKNGIPVDTIVDEIGFKPNNLKGNHFEKPIKVEPGDSLRITCTYDMASAKTPISWGLLSTNEMCSASIMYYPRDSWLHATATSFKSIPLCKLQTTGEYNGCHYGQLFDAVRQEDVTTTALAHCAKEKICTTDCSSISTIAFTHPCLHGESYDLLQSRLTKKFPALKNLIDTLELCNLKPTNNYAVTSQYDTALVPIGTGAPVISSPDIQRNHVTEWRKRVGPSKRPNVQRPPFIRGMGKRKVRRQPTFIASSVSSPNHKRGPPAKTFPTSTSLTDSRRNMLFLPQGTPNTRPLSSRPEIIAQLTAFIKSVQNPNYKDHQQLSG